MSRRFHSWTGLLIAAMIVAPAMAELRVVGPEPAPGHSRHGDAFDDGPRQKARLMPGCGVVRFPTSTKSDEARKFFEQGLGQLHGFWYFEAERSFRQAATLDPDFAIAYWGMAMANIENPKRATGFVKEAVKRKKNASLRESLYVAAAEALFAGDTVGVEARRKHIRAVEEIIDEFPDDIEAKALLACFLWQSSEKGLPIHSPMTVNALLDQVFLVEPRHPAHHYRIHLWDKAKAERGLKSARACGPAAPAIAHMWHMPGHIDAALSRFGESAWQQEASVRVDHAYMRDHQVLPSSIHNYAHNSEWLIRNLIHLGQPTRAREIAINMIEIPRHPTMNALDRSGSAALYGRARLLDTLVRFEQWEAVVALADTPWLDPSDDPAEQARRLRALGRAQYSLGRGGEGDRTLENLRKLHDSLGKSDSAKDKAPRDTKAKPSEKPSPPNKDAPSGALAKSATNGQSAKDSKSVGGTTPAPIAAVANAYQQGRILVSPKQVAAEAIKELEAWRAYATDRIKGVELLAKIRDFDKSTLAWAHAQAGQTGPAVELSTKAVGEAKNQVAPLAIHVAILDKAGKRDEARMAFDELRRVAGHAERDIACLKRLEGLAKALGYPADWRSPAPLDLDPKRPSLESLGPFLWAPFPAPAWAVPIAGGKSLSLTDFKGRPVVMILYLGAGCPHCVEQLVEFGKMASEFRAAGIDVVAIGLDPPDSASRRDATSSLPFPVASSGDLTVFRDYLAYDDFESLPLHGTVLVDGEGMVRWRDLGAEPFRQPGYLLAEAKRLLALSRSSRGPGR